MKTRCTTPSFRHRPIADFRLSFTLLLCAILLFFLFASPAIATASASGSAGERTKRTVAVCPPFKLKDELGNVIDPVRGINANAPYSPRQTCGAAGCHDYNKITEGYHFTQGKGEPVPADMAERHQWVSSPGNYGGTWCSPAPLYAQVIGGVLVFRSPGLAEYMTMRRFTLDAAHFWIGSGIMLIALVLALQHPTRTATQCTPSWLARILWGLIVFTGFCGGLVLLQLTWLETVTRFAYTGFDLGLLLLALMIVADLGRRLAGLPCPLVAETRMQTADAVAMR
jgi:hypothetical protein